MSSVGARRSSSPLSKVRLSTTIKIRKARLMLLAFLWNVTPALGIRTRWTPRNNSAYPSADLAYALFLYYFFPLFICPCPTRGSFPVYVRFRWAVSKWLYFQCLGCPWSLPCFSFMRFETVLRCSIPPFHFPPNPFETPGCREWVLSSLCLFLFYFIFVREHALGLCVSGYTHLLRLLLVTLAAL